MTSVASWFFVLCIELLSSHMDLIGSQSCEQSYLFIALMLIAEVAATPDHTNQIGWQPSERLLVVHRPVFIFIREIAGRKVVLDDDSEGKEGSNRPEGNNQNPEALSVHPVLLY